MKIIRKFTHVNIVDTERIRYHQISQNNNKNNKTSCYHFTFLKCKSSNHNLNVLAVFNYDSSHDVYLLPDLWSYMKCDFRRGKLLANDAQGVGDGFKYVLNQFRPLYFACSKGVNASHCNSGMMKFFVMPLYKWRYWDDYVAQMHAREDTVQSFYYLFSICIFSFIENFRSFGGRWLILNKSWYFMKCEFD